MLMLITMIGFRHVRSVSVMVMLSCTSVQQAGARADSLLWCHRARMDKTGWAFAGMLFGAVLPITISMLTARPCWHQLPMEQRSSLMGLLSTEKTSSRKLVWLPRISRHHVNAHVSDQTGQKKQLLLVKRGGEADLLHCETCQIQLQFGTLHARKALQATIQFVLPVKARQDRPFKSLAIMVGMTCLPNAGGGARGLKLLARLLRKWHERQALCASQSWRLAVAAVCPL
mmetsp:Transcript_154685/g.273213  ORF Transcript_154685/g.273213 Transcript_154685/m.273213 type:complete len:229 (-) Transcript_154685:254-940(-)